MAASASQIALCRSIKEALLTHYNLKDIDLTEAVDHIYNSGVSDDILILFATISHRWMGIAKYCLIHNHLVDIYVQARNWKALTKHLQQGKEMAAEIYDNQFLSPEEALALKWRLRHEFLAVKSAIQSYAPSLNTTAASHILPRPYQQGDEDREKQSLTEKCFGGICRIEGQMEIPLEVVRKRYILDRKAGDVTPISYCYDILELLADVLEDQNRYAMRSFDPQLKAELCQTYASELAMLKKYHEWLEQR